jgi:hypothetical protein
MNVSNVGIAGASACASGRYVLPLLCFGVKGMVTVKTDKANILNVGVPVGCIGVRLIYGTICKTRGNKFHGVVSTALKLVISYYTIAGKVVFVVKIKVECFKVSYSIC